MSGQGKREEAIFEHALEMDSLEARQAYLREACGEDAALLDRLQGLLRAHDRAGRFLEHRESAPHEVPPSSGPAGEPAEAGTTSRSENPGERIGRYKLLEEIGEGGFGDVWMAEQEEPVRRRVALKIIKLGMDTRSVIARFEAERQALALMDHPNIARVFDGGATESGRPYFVMELVRGLPITKYCDEIKMATRERLELFAQVCRAVQHAHQKGIIHRDLKPSNILVTEQDGRPVPKVIDFGVAKATEGRLTDKTLFTGFQQLIGTPTYMSPEQAGLGSLDIDTRSDTYSLGVVLYELLTGHPPFDTKELLKSGYEAVLRTIREVDPPKPSTRLTELVAADVRRLTTASSEQDRTSLRRLLQQERELLGTIRGDLDWIVMKCLEKDRNRRYETANGLAADVERYLQDEAIQARPPSTLYRCQKFARKHRTVVGVTTAFFLLLTAAAIVSTALALWANRERARAKVNEQTAMTEASKSRQVAKFLKNMLSGVGPSVAVGRDTTLLREILDKTAERLSKDLKDQPDVEAELRNTIGEVYEALAQYEKAEAMHRQALAMRRKARGNEHPDTVRSLNLLAGFLHERDQSKLNEAETLLREALETRRNLLGKEQLDTASSLNRLAGVLCSQDKLAEAETLLREALKIQRKRLGNEHPDVALSLNDLGLVLQKQGKLAEAEAMFREGMAIDRKLLGTEHRTMAFSRQALADALWAAGKLAEAETLYREVLPMKRKLLGDEHPSLAGSLFNLADLLRQQGKLAEAETLHREALAMHRKLFGNNHPDVGFCLHHLANVLWKKGDLPEAENLYREALALRKALLGNEHPNVADSRRDLIDLLSEQGKLAEIEGLCRADLTSARIAYTNNPAKMARPMERLLDALLMQHKYVEAEQIVREVLTPSIEKQPGSVALLRLRGTLHAWHGRFTEAATDFAQVIELDPDYDHEVWLWLGTLFATSGKLDAYRDLCRKSMERFGRTTHPLTANWIANECLLLPWSGTDLETVAEMADTSLRAGTNHWAIECFEFAKGWAEYRQGRFANAVDWLQKVLTRGKQESPCYVEACMVLAMAQHQSEQVNDARATLAKGVEAADTKFAKRNRGELGGGALDWIIAQLLANEAKTLIEGQPAASTD